MNAKINKFTKQVHCDVRVFPDFPNLKFGITDSGSTMFDATDYCIAENMEPFSVVDFQKMAARSITIALEGSDISMPNVFWENTNGHILINRVLVIAFLRYVAPENEVYFNNIIEDCLQDGIALGDTLIAKLALAKLPSDLLQEICKMKNEHQT